MGAILNEEWTADVKGRMHRYRISNPQLAAECGYNPAYLSTVLNGNKHFENDESKEQTKDRIFKALERLESAILTHPGPPEMSQSRIETERVSAVDTKLLGSTFLSAVLEFYSDSRNERAFQAWQQRRQEQQNFQGGKTK